MGAELTDLKSAPGRLAQSAGPLSGRRKRRDLTPYILIAPFFAGFLAFGAYPLLYALRLSFTKWHGSGVPKWIGFDNYTYLLSNHDFWSSLTNSGQLWLMVVPIQTIGAVAVASALSRARLRGKGFFRTSIIVPFVTPVVAMAQVWIILFDADYGPVNAILQAVGLPRIQWLVSDTWSKPSIALLILWKTTGFAIVIMLASIQGISEDMYEAASLDGANAFRQFWSITVPLMRRTISFYLVLATLGITQLFAEPYLVTAKGGPDNSSVTSGLYLYNNITNSDLGTGAANSFLLAIVVFAVSLISVRLLRSKEE